MLGGESTQIFIITSVEALVALKHKLQPFLIPHSDKLPEGMVRTIDVAAALSSHYCSCLRLVSRSGK